MTAARRLAPYALALLLVAAAAPVLRDVGVAWDEALGDLYFGDRYLSQLLAVDANANPPSHPPSLALSPFRAYPWEYFPVANMLAAASSRLLTLAGVDPFDGFHALNLALAAMLLVVLYRTVEKEESTAAAMAAVLFLFLSPRVVADLLANIKDFPEMVFFSLTLLTFFAAWQRSSLPLYLVSGACWGLALGTKTNAVFLPVIIGLFLLVERNRTHPAALAGAFFLGPLLVIAAWPWLWPNPFGRLWWNARYIATVAGSHPSNTSNPYLMLLWSTPLQFLLFIVAGAALIRPLTPFRKLIVIWIAVVLLRLPLSINFDVVRHFLELFPPLAILAGIAVARIPRPAVAIPALAIAMAFPLVRSHPFETAYWNALAGESAQPGDYWAVSYRKGMEWLNAHAERDALLAVPIAEHTVALPAPTRLRPDIHLLRYASPTRPTQDERRLAWLRNAATTRPVYVMYVLRDDWANETMRYTASLQPAAEWRAGDGRPLMRIYRLPTPPPPPPVPPAVAALAGCYSAQWIPANPFPRYAIAHLVAPKKFALTTSPVEPGAKELAMISDGEWERRMTTWELVNDHEARLTWSTGFIGITVSLPIAPGGVVLEGAASTFSDVGETPDTAKVRLTRIAC